VTTHFRVHIRRVVGVGIVVAGLLVVWGGVMTSNPTEAGVHHNRIVLRGIRRGAKIKLFPERRRYTVRAASERFLVCTKPFNLRRTVLYTVIDREEQVRGTENLIFGLGAETDEQCEAMLGRLVEGVSAVSYRNRVGLLVESVS
jgi:hypothetical protein